MTDGREDGAPEDEATRFIARALGTGDVIGHFRVVALLGQGGSGAIYEARNIHNEDERVALKILQPDIADRERFFELMRAEANAMLRLKHEAVVQYRTFGRIPESDEFYLVIEYVEGPTLGRAMRTAPLGEAALRRLALRLLEGLEAAHEQGVIHRDLSPDNVVLPGGDPDRATLIDFGIARNGGFDPLGGISFAGKLSYAAPEQLTGGAIGPWTDLYTLGLVLAAAARGAKLDMGKTVAAAIASRAAVPALDGVPAGLRPALARLLDPDPDSRVRSAAEAAALFAPVAATPPSPAPRRISWIWLAGGGLVAAIAVVAVLFLLKSPEPVVAAAPPSAPPSTPVAQPQTPPSSVPAPVDPAKPPEPKPEPKPEPRPVPKPAAPVLDARLTELVAGAEAAAKTALAVAEKAEAASREAQQAADQAGLRATEADQAAATARSAAAAACGSEPPAGHACSPGPDGRYAGEARCDSADCPQGDHGTLTDIPGDPRSFEGLWKGGVLILGCSSQNGVADYCGEWSDFAITGYGMTIAADHSLALGLFKDGQLIGPGEIDRSGVADVPDALISGEDVSSGELRGYGVITWKLGDVVHGQWRAGGLIEAGVLVTAGGLRTEAVYAEGAPATGRVVYKDGRVYRGEFNDDGRTVRRSGLGVLYDAKGVIAQQGRWQDDALVSDFGAAP